MAFDDGEMDRRSAPPARRRFRRDREHRKLLGVCAGIADYFDIDVVVVRIVWVVATVLGLGTAILVYLGVALIAD